MSEEKLVLKLLGLLLSPGLNPECFLCWPTSWIGNKLLAFPLTHVLFCGCNVYLGKGWVWVSSAELSPWGWHLLQTIGFLCKGAVDQLLWLHVYRCHHCHNPWWFYMDTEALFWQSFGVTKQNHFTIAFHGISNRPARSIGWRSGQLNDEILLFSVELINKRWECTILLILLLVKSINNLHVWRWTSLCRA